MYRNIFYVMLFKIGNLYFFTFAYKYIAIISMFPLFIFFLAIISKNYSNKIVHMG